MSLFNVLSLFNMLLLLLLFAAVEDVSSLCPSEDPNLLNWDTAAAWDNGVPTEGESAIIRTGKHVRLNVSPPSLSGITIESGASLVWGDFDNLVVTTDHINIKGTFTVGDSTCPFTKEANIRLTAPSSELKPCGVDGSGVEINNQCYLLTAEPDTFTASQRACVQLGGNLATITTSQIQSDVERYLQPKSVDAWFGLNDAEVEGTREYVDETPVSGYDNTVAGQGNSDDEDGFVLLFDSMYKWDDKPLDSLYHGLCQIPLKGMEPGVRCGQKDFGMKFGSGACYVVINDAMSKRDAEYACYTRMGQLVNVDDNNEADVLKHIYLHGQSLDYWTANTDTDGTSIELEYEQLYKKNLSSSGKKNGVVCELETLSAGQCGTGWVKSGGYCYLFTTRKESFDETLALCRQGVSDILTIHSEEENEFVSNLVENELSGHFYIGFTYDAGLGNFTWIDGSSVSYTNWQTDHGVSNVDNGECGRVRSRYRVWKNRICDNIAIVVCKAAVAS